MSPEGQAGTEMKTRNVRRRQRERWSRWIGKTDRRNGVEEDGYDERGVSMVVPPCIEAHMLGEIRFTPDDPFWGSKRFYTTTRRYRKAEENCLGYRSGNRPRSGEWLSKDGVEVYLG